jgi:sugar lactone lactonase YvrE
MAFDFKPTMTGNVSGIAELTDNNLNAAAPGFAIQSIALNVNEPGELILTASPASLDVVRGSSSTSAINLNGFTGAVTFAVQGLPANVTASFAPNPATGSSVLTLTAGSTAAAGTYNLTITGSSGAQQAATSLDLTVNATPSFALSASPSSVVVFEDASVTSTVMVLPIQPFAGDVNLTVSGLPTGVTASFGTNPTTGSSILTLTAISTAPIGAYNLTITGTSATGTQTAPASLALQVMAQRFTPPSRNFGAVNLGTTSPAQVLTYSFVAAETLGSTAVLTQGAAGLDFADAGTGTCKAGVSFAAGKTCTVDVKFTPKFAGARSGAAELLDGSGNVLATGYLQGTGVGPQVNFAPGTMSTVATAANVVMDDTDVLAVAVDGSGNVYIADQWNYDVLKETLTAGGYVESVIASYETDGLRAPTGVAVDGSGNVYIADYGGRVLKETPSAAGYAESVVANSATNGLGQPWAVAVDGSGNVYIADVHFDSSTSNYSSRVLKETLSAGGYTQSVVASNANNGQYYLVAVDGSGNVYIGDYGNSRVLKETPSAAGYTESVVTDQTNAAISVPTGLAVDGSGNLYYTAGYEYPYTFFNNSEVLKVTPSAGGYIESVLLNTANSPASPDGIAVDGAGNLYVSSSFGQTGKVDLVDPPSLSFLPTAVGSTSHDSPQTVTVSNNGNAPLIFPSSGSGGNPSVPANFALDPTSTCKQTIPGSSAPVQLAAWTSCTLALDFKPTSAAPVSGLVELTDNNQNVTGSVQGIHVVGSISQMIDFPQPASPMYLGAAPITLNATGGASGNPVTFIINSGYGSLSGPNNSVLTVTGTGTLVVSANQAGNADYSPAPEVTRSITVLLSATLTSPAPGSTLAGSRATFTWEAGTGVTECYLLLGSNGVGSSNIYNSGYTLHRSVKVTGLPTSGETIYARLYSLMNGVWHHLDYTYTAESLAALTSPPLGSTLTGSSVTFSWSSGAGISKYYLVLGSTGVGSDNLYNSGYTTHKSVNVTGLPTNGETIYARLYWQVDGDWRHLDTTYTAE